MGSIEVVLDEMPGSHLHHLHLTRILELFVFVWGMYVVKFCLNIVQLINLLS